MKKLLSYLKPYWKAALLAPILMLIEVICDLSQPTLLASIVDNGVAKSNLPYILNTGVLMLGIALIGMAGGMGCSVASSIASQNFGASLRSAVFKKIQLLSPLNIDRFKTSSLVTRLTNDITQLQTVVLMSLRIMVRAPLLFIGGIIMAVSLNARLALILTVSIPLLAAVIYYRMKKSTPLFSYMQEKLDRVNAVIRENLSGIRLIKAFVRADHEKKRFATANDELMYATLRAFNLVITMMPIVMLIMNFSIVAVLWFGGWDIDRGNMEVGEIIAFVNYITQILFSLMMIGNILLFVSRASASAERVNEVLDTDIDIKNADNPDFTPLSSGEVAFENVSFGYSGDKNQLVLKEISFHAPSGKTIAILGSTGSGKSTLVNLIPRFYDVTSGQVTVDKRDVRSMDLATLRSGMGIVPQDTILFSGTIKDNIRWGKEDATDEEIIEAARVAQAHEFIMSFPEGYDTQLGQRGVNLSGGQKQRIAIARAIIKKPPILILDDSTSAVDVVTEQRIQKALKEFIRGSTIFIIAQRISSVMDADKILVLNEGRIEAEGTHEELLKSSPLYQDIYNSQLGEGVMIDA
ncbi:MAG TPA: ABC transporter ATP-binding protein [Candidatus Atribacteria bacterium]|uniref:ABC transporter ATP-binding protein n=1 Tax=Candidatus Sordicultor fermentans TaxID=1953203 RepID=UPI0016B15844|nr:ABC transporter ATP-binding protein [Atribacterota bacterium]MDI9608341.1 ABC transporter ATP-binding protein [Atribacterota bacterium]NLY06330.1 ABC transporter ATP-binding protein [Candidatus Atribacteria bacterium]HOA99397.1 ABC transporter ATP-binding protein [Candidatus Atribacteria bacterium]HPT63086.1 ABC transporter ATP-binding protein [Candidatus Atribacteria bacterium]